MLGLDFEGRQLGVENGETVLDTLLRHSVPVAHGCKAGSCHSCLLRTENDVPASARHGLDDSVVEAGGFLACLAKAKDVDHATRFSDDFFPTYPAVLVEKRALATDVLLARFEAPTFPRCPGRFVQVQTRTGTRRPYSVATSALGESDAVDLHVRLIPGGEMSEALQAAMVGDAFTLQGPFGKCTYRAGREDQLLLLVGSGTGLAPLYAVATDALAHGHVGPIHLFFGAADPDRLYFLDELRDLARRFPTLKLSLCVDSDPVDELIQGSPLAHALATYPDLEEATVYSCGHPDLVKAAQRQCFLAGASMKRIFVDAFVPAVVK